MPALTLTGFDPTTYNSATEEYTLGQRYTFIEDPREFVYVKNVGGVALANGDGCERASATAFHVCQSLDAAGLSVVTLEVCVGIALGVVGINNFGFLLVYGDHVAAKDAANAVTAGTLVRLHTATAGNFVNCVVGTNGELAVGMALTSGASGTCKIQVRL